MTDTPVLAGVNRERLTGIDATAFQHPLDREATGRLRTIRGFDTFTAKFMEFGFERVDYFVNVASNVRVGPRQLPKLYAMLQEACAVLDVQEPELYVGQGEVNAYTFGHNRPYIVLQTGLLELMNEEETMGVIAHELGHVKCGHVLYKMMAQWMGVASELVADVSLGLGNLITVPIQAGLVLWDRRAELSADRAALLVMQDVRPCISMLMKLAGGTNRWAAQLDEEQFLEQARSYGEDADKRMGDKFYRLLASTSKGNHPFAVERAKALNEWVDGRDFERILRGEFRRSDCPKCSSAVQPDHMFCARCGHRIGSA